MRPVPCGRSTARATTWPRPNNPVAPWPSTITPVPRAATFPSGASWPNVTCRRPAQPARPQRRAPCPPPTSASCPPGGGRPLRAMKKAGTNPASPGGINAAPVAVADRERPQPASPRAQSTWAKPASFSRPTKRRGQQSSRLRLAKLTLNDDGPASRHRSSRRSARGSDPTATRRNVFAGAAPRPADATPQTGLASPSPCWRSMS